LIVKQNKQSKKKKNTKMRKAGLIDEAKQSIEGKNKKN